MFNFDLYRECKYNKENVLLLGDGFFARGFLHHIDYNKFNVFQIYKDKFINPQDIMYNLQRNKKFINSFSFQNIFYNKPNSKQENINELNIINNNNVIINNNNYYFDYLVIGLGAQKSLRDWANDINDIAEGKEKILNNNMDIIGMGPIGLELSTILSKKYKINMYDIMPKDKVFNYVSPLRKEEIINLLEKKNITLNYNQLYNNTNNNYNIFCIGTKPNILTSNYKINEYLQVISNDTIYKNIYSGGDGVLSKYIKTGQVAYQQGKYVAERLNKKINDPFEYKPNGIALNLGDNNVLIEGHNIVPDGIYPDLVIKFYSLFFV